MPESRHLSEWVSRPVDEVYEFAAEPTNLPKWAAGLGSSIDEVDGHWIAESPMGQVVVDFAPRNQFGVLDHSVTLPTGETVYNPLRVLGDGDQSEVVFTLRRRTGVSDEDYAADGAAITADLRALKQLLENNV